MRPKLKEDPYWLYALGHLPGTYDQAVAAYKGSLKLNPGQFDALA